MMYAQDYDELMVHGSGVSALCAPKADGTQDPCEGWEPKIQPYIKNWKVFVCPSNPRSDALRTGLSASPNTATGRCRSSYGINLNRWNGARFDAWSNSPNESLWVAPADTVLAAD